MKKVVKNMLALVIVVSSFFIPQVTNSYEFDSSSREQRAIQKREDIYDLYNFYKELVAEPATQSNKFGVINYTGNCSTVTVIGVGSMPLEEYVAGVVNAEIGCSERYMEMSKTQAIIARSFVIRSKQNADNCEVESSQDFQVYQAFEKDSKTGQLCMQAANETAGMVVKRNDEVALTQYQSYPAGQYQTQDSSGWHVEFQRFNDDESTKWTWHGPSKSTVLSISYGYEMEYTNPHHYGLSQTIARYLAIAEGYTYQQLIELFYAEPIVTLSDGSYDGDIRYLTAGIGTVNYYNQGNFRDYYFSSDPHNSNPYGGTIKSHGCGPTSVAIIVSTLLNDTSITPIETTKAVCDLGGCSSDGSTNGTLATTMRDVYGLNVKSTSNDQEVIDALGTNKALVIAHVKTGHFTTGEGHYIVLTGVDSNRQVSVADPGSNANTDKKWFPFNYVIEDKKGPYIIVTK